MPSRTAPLCCQVTLWSTPVITEDPEAFINSDRVSNGDTIRIATSSATIQHAADTPWVIRKSVIIEGTSQTANIEVGATGILLGADVTFRNVGLSFNMTSRNAIIANGYELSLEDVRCTNASFNLFCGGLEDKIGRASCRERV